MIQGVLAANLGQGDKFVIQSSLPTMALEGCWYDGNIVKMDVDFEGFCLWGVFETKDLD